MEKLLAILLFLCVGAQAASYQFGTYHKLFNAQSLWNSRPINPKFSTNVNATIPLDEYYPTVASGIYSTGIFRANISHPAVTVYGLYSSGINNVDGFENLPSITLPHWPANVVPASGGDGHCDILDDTTGIIHSFWQLKKDATTGRWKANQYAWTAVNGFGFGDGGHFYQGARAAGVAPAGGLIRSHEVKDGSSVYPHALAMSLSKKGLGFNPTYVYPATSADSGADKNNLGYIPEGALLMLPSTYNTSKIASADLRKVAETLKVYGAYVVDRNTGTPFAIYVENGAPFKMSNLSWDNAVAAELQKIRAALRMVVGSDRYVDGNGNTLVARTNINLLSMRGPNTSWWRSSGNAVVRFDTWTQTLAYDGSNTVNSTHENWTYLGYNQVSWAQLVVGKTYIFAVTTGGNPSLKLVIKVNGVQTYTSGNLVNGQRATFVWPSGGKIGLVATKPAGGPGRVRGTIVASTFA